MLKKSDNTDGNAGKHSKSIGASIKDHTVSDFFVERYFHYALRF
jgi:hypothetical protein